MYNYIIVYSNREFCEFTLMREKCDEWIIQQVYIYDKNKIGWFGRSHADNLLNLSNFGIIIS